MEESESEESFKSEEMPCEDACSHCGLPNHPELVRAECMQSFRGHPQFYCTFIKVFDVVNLLVDQHRIVKMILLIAN